ncbi:MAG: proton-conducting transporter membrane subunit [Clostridia bacterium]|nr:proton-conducting transporter membrane subunit [Clostridia bacterium]
MSAIQLILALIVLPIVASLVVIVIPKNGFAAKAGIMLIAVVIDLAAAIAAFGERLTYLVPWGGFGIDFAIRIDNLSAFILLAVGGFAVLVGLYSIAFLRKQAYAGPFIFYYLLTLGFVNGAVMANNLVVMLFFWEGLLVALFGMLLVQGQQKFPTAVKAITLGGIADLSLMLGIGITVYLAGTMAMDSIKGIEMVGVANLGFVCIMLGAIGKAGSMPFHSWIPDAAVDAPLPFMAFLPAALEKLLGIYLLVRIVLDFYAVAPGSTMSIVMMTIGSLTIVLAVAMALIQKDYKRLLSYHAISQVGYMVLGIGTCIPVGVVGGLFHMLNHAMYKCCLFLTGGSVEKQTGTTDLRKLGGLGKYMPITMICFIVAACSISGVPPFNGFISKELIFHASFEMGEVMGGAAWLFFIAAVLGAFLTAASFLKLGHAAFFGKPADEELKKTKEAPAAMLLPMLVLAAGCVLFGVYNQLPLQSLVEPSLGGFLDHSHAGFPAFSILVVISLSVLLLSVINHIFGVKRTGWGLGAVDHIHYAPGLHFIYNRAEEHFFDPFDIVMLVIKGFAWVAFAVDRFNDWIYNTFFVKVYTGCSNGLRILNNGSSSRYLAWSFSGVALLIIVFVVLI